MTVSSIILDIRDRLEIRQYFDSWSLSKADFLKRGDIVDSLRMGWKVPELRERLTMLVTVGMSREEHFFEKPW